MNLYDLRADVLAHGFDQTQFAGRINQYLNDALRSLARRVNFFSGEAQQAIVTVAGISTYAWPDDFGRGRHLRDVDDGGLLRRVALRDLDATSHSPGRPAFYAHNGAAVQLAPVPDDQYSLAYRYWRLPPLLAADLDVPAIPDDYHSALVYFALQRCYASEDDAQMAQYWQGQWQQALRDMAVDVKFASADGPRFVKSMWDDSVDAVGG